MNYTVIWDPAAEQELAAIWLAAADRADVTQAAYVLEGRLRMAPATEGESHAGGRRITFEPPLAINFSVDEANRIVQVLHVWPYG